MTSVPVAISDEQLIGEFAAGSLPPEMFHHRQHVRVAWLYVRKHGMPEALAAFSRDLQRFAVAKGAPNLFHVTSTWAYLLLIDERQNARAAADWDTFAAQNPDLLTWKPSRLDDYYTPELLWSERARRGFVMPDRITPAQNPTPRPAGGNGAESAQEARA
jgi:hypothetical protein